MKKEDMLTRRGIAKEHKRLVRIVRDGVAKGSIRSKDPSKPVSPDAFAHRLLLTKVIAAASRAIGENRRLSVAEVRSIVGAVAYAGDLGVSS